MSNSGIKLSELEFMTYRIVEMNLTVLKTVEMLFVKTGSDSKWEYSVSFGDITFVNDKNIYIVPLRMQNLLLQIDKIYDEKYSKEPYVSAEATIMGVFRFIKDSSFDNALKERLIRYQTPAIILPYLRSAINSMFVSAGYAGVVLPLINLSEMAKNADINIVELTNHDNSI